MNNLLDKLIITALCLVFYLEQPPDAYLVVPVLCVVTASALNSYVDHDTVKLVVYLAYCAACLYFPVFLFFLPLLVYDLAAGRWQHLSLLALLPVAAGFRYYSSGVCLFLILFLALSWLIKRRTVSAAKIGAEYIQLRDTTKEFALQLASQNKELLEKQDYEINLATLRERNRIARDIHDNIGHLLSNSILQTGALLATCREESSRRQLNTLKDTLLQGMNSIRESIHDLHEESVDLYTEVRTLLDGFSFCPVTLEYDLEGNPEKRLKYTFLAVLKEALANIIKHSNATSVKITLREHPALYQLIVKDNGSKQESGGEGIGLKNITQRVSALNGIVNINRENGFTLFISLPKEQ
jgi:signal transduction histidine kinase